MDLLPGGRTGRQATAIAHDILKWNSRRLVHLPNNDKAVMAAAVMTAFFDPSM
jgi:hypothetical protein